ncbi:hypothetical protein SDC9_205841 [bioreactor metagenome]|uniref:Uncharacterized protein n=1 Tax=bioreactor metagenome TaxID=1076179 RepID=A0A645J4S4_9ZZZZ
MGLAVDLNNFAFFVEHHSGVVIAIVGWIFDLLVHSEHHPDAVVGSEFSHAGHKGPVECLCSSKAGCTVGADRKKTHKKLRKHHKIGLILRHCLRDCFLCSLEVFSGVAHRVCLSENKSSSHQNSSLYLGCMLAE